MIENSVPDTSVPQATPPTTSVPQLVPPDTSAAQVMPPMFFPELFIGVLFRPTRVFSNLDGYKPKTAALFWFVFFLLQVLLFVSFTAPSLQRNSDAVSGVFSKLWMTVFATFAIAPSVLVVPFAAIAAFFTARSLRKRNIAITKKAAFNAYVFSAEPLLLFNLLVLIPVLHFLQYVQPFIGIVCILFAFFGIAWYLNVHVSEILSPLIKANILASIVALPLMFAVVIGTVFAGLSWTMNTDIDLEKSIDSEPPVTGEQVPPGGQGLPPMQAGDQPPTMELFAEWKAKCDDPNESPSGKAMYCAYVQQHAETPEQSEQYRELKCLYAIHNPALFKDKFDCTGLEDYMKQMCLDSTKVNPFDMENRWACQALAYHARYDGPNVGSPESKAETMKWYAEACKRSDPASSDCKDAQGY